MQQVGVIALLGGRRAEGLEALIRISERIDAGAPALVGERRIGHHKIVLLDVVAILELGVGQRVALRNQRGGVVVQNHVHAGKAAGGGVFFLPFQRDRRACFVADFQQQRTGAAGGIVNGGGGTGFRLTYADDLRHDAADFRRRVELALALAALGGEVAHQVFVGIAQNIIAVGAVFGEIQRLVLEDADQVGEPVHHLLAAAELAGIVEIRHVGELVGIGQWRDDFFVDVVADAGLALERHHVFETRTVRDGDRRKRLPGEFVADVFDEQQHQHVILVLAGIHAAAQFVAACPQGAIEFRFFDGHLALSLEIRA